MSKKIKELRNNSLESIEEKESNMLLEQIQNDQELLKEAGQDAISSFKESGDKKDNAQGLMAGAIFNLFKYSNHNQVICDGILKAQQKGNKTDVSNGFQELYTKLGLIKTDVSDSDPALRFTELSERYKEFNKDNKGFQTIVSDANKLALAAWNHRHDAMELTKLGNGKLIVKVRNDFWVEDSIAAGDNASVIGRKRGYKPFSELMTTAKQKLGLTVQKQPKSAGGTEAEQKPLTLNDIALAMKSLAINQESFDAKELELIGDIERACVQIRIDNSDLITGKAKAA